MKFYQETTTDWLGNIPNHVYLLNDSRDRMWGYVPSVGGMPSVGGDLKIFVKPLPFDARRRRFKPVPNIWGWQEPKRVVPANSVEVRGSRGDIYTVTRDGSRLTCSCSGYKFRGACRHITEVERTQQPA